MGTTRQAIERETVIVSYKRKFLYDRPYMHVKVIECGNCYEELVEEWDKGLVCPDCGAIFEDVTNTRAYASPDWHEEETIPDLFLNKGTKIPRDAKISVKLNDHPDYPFMITINKDMVCLCQTREQAEQEIRKLKTLISDHYVLQDRKEANSDEKVLGDV